MDSFDNFDIIMDDINKAYDDFENDYNEYIKMLKIVPYKPVDYTIITYLNCVSVYFNYMLLKMKL